MTLLVLVSFYMTLLVLVLRPPNLTRFLSYPAMMEEQHQEEQQVMEEQQEEEAGEVGPLKIEILTVPTFSRLSPICPSLISRRRCAPQEQGANMKDIEKLQAAGLYTVEAVAYSTLKSLTAIKGITDVKALKLIDAGTWHTQLCSAHSPTHLHPL
jgi:hypothetical protein